MPFLKLVNMMADALWTGFADGWSCGPEIDVGMTYPNDRAQRFYDAATYLGCGVAVLVERGWIIGEGR